MSGSRVSLLGEIEDDLVSGRPIADTLRKVVILGGQAGSVSLRDWAVQELKGYEPSGPLPGYRVVGATICVDALVGNGWVKGQRLSVHELPKFAQEGITEEVDLRFPIGEIEALIRTTEGSGESSVRLSPPGAAELVLLWNRDSDVPFQHIQSVYWSVGLVSLHGVVDQVRVALTELVAEMRAGTPTGEDVPTPDVTNQAVNVAVRGENARITVMHQTSGRDLQNSASPAEPGWWTAGRIVWSAVIGLATIAAGVFAYVQWKG